MTLHEQITFFFAPPDLEQQGDLRSPLHLVRREAQDCLIGKLVSEDSVVVEAHKGPHRLFATTMVLMAGIDLLAKFCAGSDEPRKAGERIMKFCERFLFNGLKQAARLSQVLYYGCRNPVLHSFTLHNQRYRITLTTGFSHGVIRTVRGQPDLFVISIEGLYLGFVQSCRSYEAALRADQGLQERFASMFPKYGTIQFQSYVVQSREGLFLSS